MTSAIHIPHSTIAIVTGANRGIGLEICRQLAQKDIQILLTSRDEAKGKAAQQALVTAGLNVAFHQLDVTDAESISRLAAFVDEGYGRLAGNRYWQHRHWQILSRSPGNSLVIKGVES